MSRRVSLPAADDLFRTTRHARELRERGSTAREMAALLGRVEPVDPAYAPVRPAAEPSPETAAAPVQAAFEETAAETAARKSSGRVRHDEKMTVYVTAGELLDIEHARLSLRRDQGLAVDRGRLVREAIAIALEDLEENGDDSVLVQRLIGR
ncbi:MAG: hypothetical protein JWO88_7 [Frankiales bacterium]|nr:hypothetical protein [Frankiales bacterium]